MPTVTSRHNAVVARFRAAARRDAGLTFREAAVGVDAGTDVARLVERLRRSAVPIVTVSASVMGALSPVRSPSSITAIASSPVAKRPEFYGRSPLVVVAIDVQDPGNLGAIVRTAEAGGASGIVCAGACADPFGWKALRGSMGSVLRFPILAGGDPLDAIQDARHHGCRIVAAVPRDGIPLFDANLAGPVALLFGGEGQGLTTSQIAAADERVTIPMEAPVESLNASVAAALTIYEARRQRQTGR